MYIWKKVRYQMNVTKNLTFTFWMSWEIQLCMRHLAFEWVEHISCPLLVTPIQLVTHCMHALPCIASFVFSQYSRIFILIHYMLLKHQGLSGHKIYRAQKVQSFIIRRNKVSDLLWLGPGPTSAFYFFIFFSGDGGKNTKASTKTVLLSLALIHLQVLSRCNT